MARPATRPRKSGRVASPLVIRKSSRQPKRPTKVTVARELSPPAVQNPRKPKTRETLSIGDGIEEARVAIGGKAKATFDDVHAGFTRRLAAIRVDDEAFFQRVEISAKTLTVPLEDEKVQTSFIKNGKTTTEFHRVGDRVADFKKIIEKEEKNLKDLWKQWDDVQNEYLELGIEIWGERAFGVECEGQVRERGFQKEMTLLGLEHDARIEELEEEIEDIGPDLLKKMKASEKESYVAAKKDQARLLQTLL
ncbi:uncharacterized protein RSE6_05246 [Rhynchosporium secalis]|uniref:Uncharacterized protein n=1 Tax=Rhynchosporium secalis TaxID=38038 RepID=A0A1E1M7A3_RHYSE|nr:uncharacterized protein RSE6_05246 [Rhynchosporium secalis]